MKGTISNASKSSTKSSVAKVRTKKLGHVSSTANDDNRTAGVLESALPTQGRGEQQDNSGPVVRSDAHAAGDGHQPGGPGRPETAHLFDEDGKLDYARPDSVLVSRSPKDHWSRSIRTISRRPYNPEREYMPEGTRVQVIAANLVGAGILAGAATGMGLVQWQYAGAVFIGIAIGILSMRHEIKQEAHV